MRLPSFAKMAADKVLEGVFGVYSGSLVICTSSLLTLK